VTVDLRRELTDPATLVLAGILGGMAGAVVAAEAVAPAGVAASTAGGLAAGVVVAGLVLGAKVAATALLPGVSPDPPAEPADPRADPVTAATGCLRRATDAVAAVRQHAVLVTDPHQLDTADDLVAGAAGVVNTVHRHVALVVRSAGGPTGGAVAGIALDGIEAAVSALEHVAGRLASPVRPPLVTLVDDLQDVADYLARTEAEARAATTPPVRP
jgi:hypothetical protein